MIIVDTGFWLALVDQKDTYHEAAKQALGEYQKVIAVAQPALRQAKKIGEKQRE